MATAIGFGLGVVFQRGATLNLSAAIQAKLLFYGWYSEIAAGKMPNKLTGATDWLTISGSAGSETYQCPNTAPYIATDTDYIWFKTDASQRTTTTAELIGYDFPRTFIKYDNTTPYALRMIAILKAGETLTTSESNEVRDWFELSVWWDNTLSFHGKVKQNRGVGKSIWTPESVFDSSAAALFTRMTNVSETPDDTRKTLINNTILALKSFNLWDKHDAIYAMAAHGANSGLLNWIGNIYNLTKQTSPTFATDRGYTAVVSGSHHLNTNFNPSTAEGKFALNDACYWIYIRTNNANLNYGDIGAETSNLNGIFFQARTTPSDQATIAINGGYQAKTVTALGCLFVISRISSTYYYFYRDKVVAGEGTKNSTTLPNTTIRIGVRNIAGTITLPTNREYSMMGICSQLSATDVGHLYDVMVDGYLQSIGGKV